MYLVLAGNFVQAREWAATNKIARSKWKYIFNYENMLGLTPDTCDLILIGTWRDNEITMETYEWIKKNPRWFNIIKDKKHDFSYN